MWRLIIPELSFLSLSVYAIMFTIIAIIYMWATKYLEF